MSWKNNHVIGCCIGLDEKTDSRITDSGLFVLDEKRWRGGGHFEIKKKTFGIKKKLTCDKLLWKEADEEIFQNDLLSIKPSEGYFN